MLTAWMGPHRELVEKFIKLLNTYARIYSIVSPLGNSGLLLSPAKIQTIEYIMENDGQKMSEIASRMGITRGTFSNTVNKLVDEGYVFKEFKAGNKKDICLGVTPAGKKLYSEYAEYIYHDWFLEMFSLLDTMTDEDKETLKVILDGFTEMFRRNLTSSGNDTD